jgi:hypothetical protein
MEQYPDSKAQMTKSFQFCSVGYKSGLALSLKEVRRRFDLSLITDDPNLKLEARWGDEKAASTCPRY